MKDIKYKITPILKPTEDGMGYRAYEVAVLEVDGKDPDSVFSDSLYKFHARSVREAEALVYHIATEDLILETAQPNTVLDARLLTPAEFEEEYPRAASIKNFEKPFSERPSHESLGDS
jgi:hypothetical protein